MKLTYCLVIFIYLFSLFLCGGDVLMDTELEHIPVLCTIFTGTEPKTNLDDHDGDDEVDDNNPQSDEMTESQSDVILCDGQLKKEFLTIYPVAPCLIESDNGKRYLTIFESESYFYPEVHLGSGVICTRFPFKGNNHLFADLQVKNKESVIETVIEGNKYLREGKFDKAINSYKSILVELDTKEKDNFKGFVDYINENLAFTISRKILHLKKRINKSEMI
jgi:hypothetical protein